MTKRIEVHCIILGNCNFYIFACFRDNRLRTFQTFTDGYRRCNRCTIDIDIIITGRKMLRRIVMNRNFIHDSCICIKDSLIPILVITIAIAAFSDAHDAWINCGHRLVEIIITGGKDICCAGIRHPTSPSFISDFPPCNSIRL